MQYAAIFKDCKNNNFQMTKKRYFSYFAQNIDCGYTLEPPLTSTHNLCFRAKIRKIMYNPVHPSYNIEYRVGWLIDS